MNNVYFSIVRNNTLKQAYSNKQYVISSVIISFEPVRSSFYALIQTMGIEEGLRMFE